MSRDPRTGPIAGATAALLDWLTRAGVAARVSLPGTVGADAPDKASTSKSTGPAQVLVWPLAVLPEQTLRTAGGREPLRMRVRHLIPVDGPASAAGTPLDLVLGAAAEDGDFPLVIEPIPNDMWLALGVKPQLGLQVDMHVHVARTARVAPLVRAPLRMDHAPMRSMRGRVVGPEGVPLAGIRVQATSTGTTTYTDSGGHFVLAGLVSSEGGTRLLLSGRGLHLQAEVAATAEEPVVIQCHIEEV